MQRSERVRPGVQRCAVAFLAAVLGLAAIDAVAAPEKQGPKAPETKLVGVVNVNTATPDQLEMLPGVGPVRAKAIVDYRRDHGAFQSADDLRGVSGIGDRALGRIRAHVATAGKTTARLQ